MQGTVVLSAGEDHFRAGFPWEHVLWPALVVRLSKPEGGGSSPRPPLRRWVWRRWGRCLPPPARPPAAVRWWAGVDKGRGSFVTRPHIPVHPCNPALATHCRHPVIPPFAEPLPACPPAAPRCAGPTPPLPQGLTKLLADHAPGCIKEQKFENYFGRKIAVDASMHIYAFLVRTPMDACQACRAPAAPPPPKA